MTSPNDIMDSLKRGCTWCNLLFTRENPHHEHGSLTKPCRAPDQDKLEPSEALGDLLRRAGDNDAALAVFQRANIPGKVIEGLAAKGDFDALSKYRCGVFPKSAPCACDLPVVKQLKG